jgi:hypothetical protein
MIISIVVSLRWRVYSRVIVTILNVAANCPTQWKYCPTSSLRTAVTFTHLETLDEGILLYELYRVAESITSFTRSRLEGNEIEYIGYESVSADITLSLNGVPEGQMMDDVQLKYLADVTTGFLREKTDNTVKVLSMEIQRQYICKSPAARRLRLLQHNCVQIEGRILGAETVSDLFTNDNFRIELEDTFRDEQDFLLEKLIVDTYRPGPMNEEGRVEYFDPITGVGGQISIDEVAQVMISQDEVAMDRTGIIIAVFAAIAVAAVVVVVLFIRRRNSEKAENSLDRRAMKFRNQRSIIDIRYQRQRSITDLEAAPMQSQMNFPEELSSKLDTKEIYSSESSSDDKTRGLYGGSLDIYIAEGENKRKVPQGSSKSVQLTPSGFGPLSKVNQDAEDVSLSPSASPLVRSKLEQNDTANYCIGKYPGNSDSKPQFMRQPVSSPRTESPCKLRRLKSSNNAGTVDFAPNNKFLNKEDGGVPAGRGRIEENRSGGGALNRLRAEDNSRKRTPQGSSNSVQTAPARPMGPRFSRSPPSVPGKLGLPATRENVSGRPAMQVNVSCSPRPASGIAGQPTIEEIVSKSPLPVSAIGPETERHAGPISKNPDGSGRMSQPMHEKMKQHDPPTGIADKDPAESPPFFTQDDQSSRH